MQVDPIEPKLKTSGTKRLKLKYDQHLSNVAVKFNLRRYNLDKRTMQYTYADGDQYVFMDMETFEETRIEEGDFTKFLKEVGPHRTKYVKALRH